ncbi:MAG: DNA methyltransferase [Xanthomonadales bacterium]|nr:DNA methyltransferase [Xanthomonadales bacterium]
MRDFHRKLCEIRILDPACGSGNFLYVTLEHMKRLEGEILGTLNDLGEGQNLLEMQGNTVDPHQFLGIEINPRAAAIAEMVLWIGYLQWHFRTHGHINPPQPVLRAFENIECRDAVLAYDRWEYKMNEDGRPVMRWDGKTYKKSPTTGEDIPDESAQVPEEVYINPRKAEWPEADYVVGNPPFIGARANAHRTRRRLRRRVARDLEGQCPSPATSSCTGGTRRPTRPRTARSSNSDSSQPTASARRSIAE